MKIVCIKNFRDKTTAEKIQDQVRIVVGDILDCDDELAKERIKKGFAKEYIDEVKDEVTDEVKDEVTDEVKDEVTDEVKDEVKPRKRDKK